MIANRNIIFILFFKSCSTISTVIDGIAISSILLPRLDKGVLRLLLSLSLLHFNCCNMSEIL